MNLALNLAAVKERIVPRVLNIKNLTNVDGIVSKVCGDIALIYRICVAESEDAALNVNILPEMLNEWGISEKELHEIAVSNITRNETPMIDDMESAVSSLLFGLEDNNKEIPLEEADPLKEGLYVVSNHEKHQGASSLTAKWVLEKLDEISNDGCYILPSSIHEFIVTCCERNPETDKELLNMVREINRTEVKPQDVLSNNILYCDSKKHTIQVYDGEKWFDFTLA